MDAERLRAEVEQVRGYLEQFGDRLPPEMRAQLEALERKLA